MWWTNYQDADDTRPSPYVLSTTWTPAYLPSPTPAGYDYGGPMYKVPAVPSPYSVPTGSTQQLTPWRIRKPEVRGVRRRGTRVCHWWLWLLFMVLLLAAATALALGLYMALGSENNMERSEVNLTVTLEDWTYKSDLQYPESLLYREYATYICDQLSKPLLSSNISEEFEKCEVTKFEEGSVRAYVTIIIFGPSHRSSVIFFIFTAIRNSTIFISNIIISIVFANTNLCVTGGQPSCEFTCVQPDDTTYSCLCEDGYRQAPDQLSCIDVNECLENVCNAATSSCTNTDGGYECTCLSGFVKTGDKCLDIDECADTSTCNVTTSSCQNTFGSYECVCQTGFEMQNGDCTDIDECADPAVCDVTTSSCENNFGGFECACLDGFTKEADSCVDVNECDASPCNTSTSYCDNLVGSFECVCLDGFVKENDTCTDINECDDSTVCNTNTSSCENNFGSFECVCLEGFMKENENDSCTDIDECDQSPCNTTTSSCENSFGDFECVCLSGFEKENDTCQDINECDDSTVCNNTTSSCENNFGSFECVCLEGFMKENDSCTDIDECDDVSVCNITTSSCDNNLGSFECVCLSGYEKENDTCVDVDECSTQTDDCDNSTSQCVNTPGSYDCTCLEGFKKNDMGQCVVACGTRLQQSGSDAAAFIIGGNDAAEGAWPWQALLKENDTFTCAATIIDTHWALTAGHCISQETDPATLTLHAGSNHRTTPSSNLQSATVSQIHIHPDYLNEGTVHDNDLALLQLADPGFQYNAHVRPVCLPEANATSTGCHTAGWGAISQLQFGQPEELADTLQEAAMLGLSAQRCNDKLQELGAEPMVEEDSMTCAGYLDGTVSVCLSDSGGSLACPGPDGAWTAYGITSWAVSCRFFSVFTRLPTYVDWIEATLAGGN